MFYFEEKTYQEFNTSSTGLVLCDFQKSRYKMYKMYKTLNGNVPRYLQEIFTSRVSSYELRDFENKLFVPKPRTDYLKRSFGYSGAVLWNSLSSELRSAQSLASFKRGLEGWLCSMDSSQTAIM